MPDLYVNVFRINRTPKKDSLVQFLCFFCHKKKLQDPCDLLNENSITQQNVLEVYGLVAAERIESLGRAILASDYELILKENIKFGVIFFK